jgi:hypothetical protein
MFGLPVLLAALAFAGAPTNTPVVCNPALFSGQEGGQTIWSAIALPSMTPLGVQRVELSAGACGGILLLAASPTERTKIAKLNPRADVPRLEGVGALVALHEASHAALLSTDETLVECRAMAMLPAFLERYLSGSNLAAALSAATADDAALDPKYHTHPCP